ncbi:MAG TPA: VWA domain-containing protein [Gemmataceae bacterium]|jgi:Ca-activated chloride channel family protein|nr:VWA domain-containing protein [Gemmataceae bacterium]
MNLPRSIFEYSGFIWLLSALPVLAIIQWWSAWRKRRALGQLASPLAYPLLLPPRPRFRWLAGLLFSFGMLALITGAASPFWGEDPKPALVAGRDVVLVLDMSGSMKATDAPPSRFERARRALLDLTRSMEQRGGHRLALVVFAGDVQIVCPATHDYHHIRTKIEALDIDHPPANLRPKPDTVSGTRIGLGLKTGLALLDEQYRGYQDIILLSDGDDPLPDAEWQQGLNASRAAGVPISTVGIGDPDHDSLLSVPGQSAAKSRLHEHPLQELARQTGGSYLSARIEEPRLMDFFQRQIASKPGTMFTEEVPPQPKPQQVWFYLAALMLLGSWWFVRKED